MFSPAGLVCKTALAVDGTYRWEEMNYFWFEDRWGSRILRISINKLPWQLIVVVNKEGEADIKKIMVDYVIFQVPKPNKKSVWENS